MYLRRCYRAKDGKRHAYWALVKSVRTARGPRQEVVAYLGEMDEVDRLGMKDAAEGNKPQKQGRRFAEPGRRSVEVDPDRVRVENGRAFGGMPLGYELFAGNKADVTAVQLSHRVGRLLGQNTRVAGGFKTEVVVDPQGNAQLQWEKVEAWRSWASLSEGCYLLPSNVSDWTAAELWQAYMQLTEAEGAFHIHKSDLSLRPIWHQKKERVQAHVLVCFLAYVLWKTLGQMCKSAGLGDEPRKVLEEIGRIQVLDVVLPTQCGLEIKRRCVMRPTAHQSILLDRLGLRLPERLKMVEM